MPLAGKKLALLGIKQMLGLDQNDTNPSQARKQSYSINAQKNQKRWHKLLSKLFAFALLKSTRNSS